MRRTVAAAWVGPLCAGGAPLAAEEPIPAAPPVAQPRVCAESPCVSVAAAQASDAQTACEGARRALEFLARAGLDAAERTTVEIVPELPGELGGKALGCCVPSTRRILLPSYAAFEASGGWFGLPPSRELYRAVASHGVAHAVVGCHSEPRRLPVAAHAYVAYVVQFATMEPAVRAAILARFRGPGFGASGRISDLAHVVNPNRFGVDAWRHCVRIADRERWLAKVIAGEVVPEPVADPGAETR